MPGVIAIVGISGVGKSTLIRRLADSFVFQHLQASAVIKSERDALAQGTSEIDTLRGLPIDENQKLLVSGFSRLMEPSASFVGLDGHTIIDTPAGLIEIPPTFSERSA